MADSYDDDDQNASIQHEMEDGVPLYWDFYEMEEDVHMDFEINDVLSEESDFHELNE